MRTLRATMVGLVVLALLGGLGAAAAAQCETSPVLAADFVYSTGTFRQVEMEEGEYIATGDVEGSRERGGSVTIRIESDDPRISGDLVIDPYNTDEGPGIATSGIFLLGPRLIASRHLRFSPGWQTDRYRLRVSDDGSVGGLWRRQPRRRDGAHPLRATTD